MVELTAMIDVLGRLPAVVPNPIEEGTLRPGLEPSQVTPGLVGFLASLLLAVVVILLVLDFNRRNRRLRYRAEYAERRAAEEGVGGYAERAGNGVPSGAAASGTTPGPDDRSSTASSADTPDAASPDAAPGADDPGESQR